MSDKENKTQTIYEKLESIQQNISVPKDRTNSFGGFDFRNAEDILIQAKKLLKGYTILLSDEVLQVGDRIYVKSTATLSNGSESICVSANAREAVSKKGMDDAQITGAATSYARKRALEGLFAIDSSDHDPDESQTQSKREDDDAIKDNEKVLSSIRKMMTSAITNKNEKDLRSVWKVANDNFATDNITEETFNRIDSKIQEVITTWKEEGNE